MSLLKNAAASGAEDPAAESTASTENTNQIDGATQARTDLSTKLRTMFPDLAIDGEDEVDSAPKTPIAAFRHKTVRLFQVGPHTFYDHVLYIYSDEELESFANLFKTLSGVDKTNIVAYDWEAAARIESDAGQAIRGMLTTRGIKDPKTVR